MKLIVIIIPEKRETNNNIWELTQQVLNPVKPVYDSHLPRKKLIGILENLEIKYLDCYPYFVSRNDIYIPNDGHFTARAHRLVADELYRIISSDTEGILKSRKSYQWELQWGK